jgi:hypothetical protein
LKAVLREIDLTRSVQSCRAVNVVSFYRNRIIAGKGTRAGEKYQRRLSVAVQ